MWEVPHPGALTNGPAMELPFWKSKRLDEMTAEDSGPIAAAPRGELVCVLQQERSRITGAAAHDLLFDWREDGCVNGRTQYGFASGEWSRVFVPNEEEAVSVNVFDPATATFRTESV